MIKAGLIGGKLSHSLSPQIHKKYWHLTAQQGEYQLLETPAERLGPLLDELTAKGYAGVNVTIPHKRAVMQYLDVLSPEADAIGAVNTVHFTGGRRAGHNTDYFGLKSMLLRHGITLGGQRVVILGSGGAARCAYCLARDEGAAEIYIASRKPQEAEGLPDVVGYQSLEDFYTIGVLINTTPVGMHPDTQGCPVADSVIKKCAAVADLIYNPAQTVLLQKAAAFGKACAGGLWMLCAQALKAQEIWTGRAYDEALCASIYSTLQTQPKRTNTVLIGMPGSGKTTIGQLLAQRLGQPFADTDTMIEAAHGRIQDIFETQGEPAFRTLELSAARQAAALTHSVISTGGGIVLTQAAINALAETGIIVYIDRPLELLLLDVDTAHRPLLKGGRQRLITLFSQRQMLYRQYANITVPNTADPETCVDIIIKQLKEQKR